MSQVVYLDRREEPVEGLGPVVCKNDDPEGGDGGQEVRADGGVTKGNGERGHQVHGQLLMSLPLLYLWSPDMI